jgi:hypothetical protein
MYCNGNLEGKTFVSHTITALPQANEDLQAESALMFLCCPSV